MIPNSYNDSTIFLPNSRKSSIRFMIANIFIRNIIFILFSYDKKKKWLCRIKLHVYIYNKEIDIKKNNSWKIFFIKFRIIKINKNLH